MKKLKSISILIITFVVLLLSDVYINKDDVSTNDDDDDGKARDDRIASVINAVFDEYGLFNSQVGSTDSIIRIEMDEANSEQELLEYLEKNISKADLRHYNIKILKRNLKEVQTEHAMLLLEGIAMDYIKEKNYNDVQVYYPNGKPEQVLKIIINETSERSSEDLKAELENFLATKGAELPVPLRDISYEIQIIKV
ncbi:hypothetical protein LIT38_03915 [Bacillus sp. CMF12]|uniref:hypothetical protein n=1 Tax=Bacillaceae TaxID=186817 RepID=UPI001FB1D67A|nr:MULTISPECIES: hypothetical protein [Bacillaceae]UOE56139.1 hypothetical protein IRB79_05105 [Cytobacillus oceanisediminis]USK50618.1 hypothetical protein LIT38_03915 [Bacillus sp. CMF12]